VRGLALKIALEIRTLFIGHDAVPGKAQALKTGGDPRFVAEKRDAASCGKNAQSTSFLVCNILFPMRKLKVQMERI